MKKIYCKIVSALTAFCMVSGAAALAAPVTSGGSGTDYGYYWCQNFNDLPEDMSTNPVRKSNASLERASVAEGDYALDVTATGSNGFAIIDSNSAVDRPLPKFDFSKGAMVLSFDLTMNNLTSPFYLQLRSSGDANTDMLGIMRVQNSGRICGFAKKADSEYVSKAGDLEFKASNNIAKIGTKYSVQTALVYDKENEILTVKQYLNGEQMTLQNTNTPIEYQYHAENMDALLSGNMFMRFAVPTKGGSVRLDNITLRSEGNVDLPNVGYIGAANQTANIVYTDSAEYDPDCAPSAYQKAINKIPASQTVLSGDNAYYTLTKYSIDNPLLLKAGTPAESKVGWKGSNGMNVSGLDIASNNEFYILKLKDNSLITNFSGKAVSNNYICLRRAAMTAQNLAARETTILDGDGNALTLDLKGRLPRETRAIKFVTAGNENLTEDNVKMVGTDGKIFTGVQSSTEPNVWTINIDELSELTDYTITLSDFSQTVRTNGNELNAFYWYEGFDSYDGAALPDGFSNPGTGIRFEKAGTDADPALRYVNEYAPTSGTSNFSIKGKDPLDFSKGALILSYDVTPQTNLTWIANVGNILIPTLKAGGTEISQLSIIEHGGIKAAYKTSATAWGRSGYLTDWQNNTLVADTTVKFQLLLKKEGNQITATQYVNGKPVYYTVSGETKLASVTVDITDEELAKEWTLTFAGRRFPNGLIFDNFHITTVDGVTASDEITLADNAVTAQIDLENTLRFAQNAPAAVKQLKMQNAAQSSDFEIKKYDSTSDPLLLDGEKVSDFDLNNMGETLVLSRLPERKDGEIFVIGISDASKIQTMAGKNIDTTVFKAGKNPSGLKKTRLLDAEGDEIFAKDKIIPSALSKMELTFTKNTDFAALPVITNTEKNYSLTAVSGEDGVYRFDFNNAALSPNTVYTVTYGTTSAQFTTGAGTIQASAPVIDSDGKASVTVTNTSQADAKVYIISAYYDSEGDLVSTVKYENFTVEPGQTKNIAMTEAHSAPEKWAEQKVFVWDGFENMNPYCAYGSRKNQ